MPLRTEPAGGWVRWKGLALPVGLILLAAWLASANSLRNGFLFDDRSAIVENPKVTQADWSGIWREPSWFPLKGDRGWRPLTTSSFAFDWLIHGPKPAYFRAKNILLHGLNSVLVFQMARLLQCSPYASLAAGLLFALHPAHTEVLNPIVGRGDLLTTACFLLALWAYVRGRTLAALLIFAFSFLVKENTVTFLFMLPVLDIYFFRRLRLKNYLLFGAVLAGYLCLRRFVAGEFMPTAQATNPWDNPLISLTAGGRASNALFVAARYVFLLFVPYPLSADYSYNAIPMLPVLSARNVCAGALLAGSAAGLAWWSLRNWRAGFLALFFALTFALVSNIPFPIGTVMADRLLYLPSAAFCVLAALGFEAAWLPRGCGRLLLALYLAFYAVLTLERNKDWASDAALFKRTLETSPHSAKAMVNAGKIYLEEGNFELARDLNLKAIELNGLPSLPYSNLGLAYKGLRRYAEAEKAFWEAIQRDPESLDGYVNLGIIYGEQYRYDDAIALFTRALALRPGAAKIHYNMAFTYKLKGGYMLKTEKRREAHALFRKALEHYDAAVLIDPGYSQAVSQRQSLSEALAGPKL
ncbi:MAG: tetratricopeptide repeat protein [Elusimicrobia bacterium]|nr:tetratricopeptide repeat protein [Elusimicrobiota bacterium]